MRFHLWLSLKVQSAVYTRRCNMELRRRNFLGADKAGGIYGVEWDGSSSSVMTRTDDAAGFSNPNPYYAGMSGSPSSPFDTLSPWKDMERVEDAEAGSLVKIPKFWFKWTRSGSSMKLQISPSKQDGFLVSPAHADRGDGNGERDFVYVGRYHCSTNNYKSVSGVKPKVSITRGTARTNIANLGSDVWQLDYAMLWTVNMLYLVEFANWDSQATIGYGCGNNSATENSGKTDSMPYHTGTMANSRTTYATGIQYRYIEDWWANVLDWVDGIYFSSSNVYNINDPSKFSDSTNGVNTGKRTTSSGYIKTWSEPSIAGYEYAIYPNAVNGSTQSYVNDRCYYTSSGVVLYFGGYYNGQSQSFGAFYLDGHVGSSSSYSDIGCRLQKLP